MKRVQSIILVLAMVLSLFSGLGTTAYALEADYTGQTDAGNYTITTPEQLALLATTVNAGTTYEGSTFRLTNDIDLSGYSSWTPIAKFSDSEGNLTSLRFMGTFDGDGHYVEDINISALTASYEGYSLFGAVGTGGTVKDLGVTGDVASYRCAAGIAGYNFGTISHCFSEVTVSANGGGGLRGSGGIVGHNEGTVEYCINAGTVHNDYRRAGGIVGYNYGTAARIDHCYNVGNVTSATSGYAGAIAATNGESATTAGIVTDSYFLTGSAVAVFGVNSAASTDTTAFNPNAMLLDSSGNATTTSLKSALNDDDATAFKDTNPVAYPVLFWQDDYKWNTCTITIDDPAGGTLTATVNENAITGSVDLVAGTCIVLTASAPDAEYLFNGFTATVNSTTTNLGGTSKEVLHSITYTVSTDATLSANYLSTGTDVLTISSRAGVHGKSTVLDTKTWKQLIEASITYSDGYGYMYTHGSDGWNMVAATQYVPITSLLSGLITPAATDKIVASAEDGSPSVTPTWSLLNSDLYFFPNATTSTTGGSIAGKVPVPSALALSWAGGAVNTSNTSMDTAEEALSATAANAYNSVSLRMVYGCTENDYTNLTSGSTIQGNRLWRGVTDLAVAKTPTTYTGTLSAASLKDSSNNNRTPYYSYGVTFDSSTQKVSISASGLTAFTDGTNGSGDWVGIAIPLGTTYSSIHVGSNNSAMTDVSSNTSNITSASGIYYYDYKWDYNNIDSETGDAVEYIQFSLDGGTTVYEIAVDTSGITANAVDFCGVGLSLDMIKAHPTTAQFTMNGTAYTVTGIKVSDILKYYATTISPAALKFGTSTATVYDCAYIGTGSAILPQYPGYGWDQSMLIWSQLDSSNAEKITSGIKSAVNGGTGKMWWSGVTTVTKITDAALTIKDTNGILADRFVSLAQLKEHVSSAADFKKMKSDGTLNTSYSAITGVSVGALVSSFVPGPTYVTSLYFSDASGKSNMFQSTTYSGLSTGLLGDDFDNGMLVWSSNVTSDSTESKLTSALNGGTGKYWWNNVISMTYAQTNKVAFSITPASAAVVVKDGSGVAMSQSAINTYILPNGAYTYTISASGYTTSSGALTVADNNQTIATALEADTSGGGGSGGSTTYKITGYSGTNGTVSTNVSTAASGENVTLTVTPANGYVLTDLDLSAGTLKESLSSTRKTYTFAMPSSTVTVTATFEQVELTVYVKNGSGGTAEVGALFSRSQLEALSNTTSKPTTGYLYYKNGEWDAVVATQYVTLDNLLANAGISFGSGDSINASAADGFYDSVSYKNIQNYQYYFDPNNNGARSVAPYIIALKHYTGTLSGSTLSKIVSGSPETNLRSCYGCSQDQYAADPPTAYGRRLVSSVTSLTIINSAEVNKNTKDGVTPETTVKEVTVTAQVTVANGTATASVSSSDVTKAITTADSSGSNSVIEISAVSGKETTTAEVTFAASTMDLLKKSSSVAGLKITTDEGTIVLDKSTLDGVASEAGGKAVTVTIDKPEKTALTAEQQELAGDNTVYALTITAADQKITDFDGKVTVSLPYKLTDGEDASNVVIYYLSSEGKIEKFAASYDAKTGLASFTTNHFSVYMTAYEATVAYADVMLTNWYYSAVNDVVKKGIMTGTSATTFDPNRDTTRAMLATVLWRQAGKPAASLTTSPFADVQDKTAWYYDAVLWAYEKGIVKGLSETTFSANRTVSRQELVTMLYRYSQVNSSSLTATNTADVSSFSDWGTVSDWAEDSFRWAYKNGLVTGLTETTLSPGSNATRAQIASILTRYQ
jgi:hypothetical protein